MSDIGEMPIGIACSECEVNLVSWEHINSKYIKLTRGNGVDCPECGTHQPTYYV